MSTNTIVKSEEGCEVDVNKTKELGMVQCGLQGVRPSRRLVRSNQRTYKQHYRKAWEQVPDFKGWLKGVPGDTSRAYCLVCEKKLHAHRLTLLKHTTSIRHMKTAQMQHEQKTLAAESKAKSQEKRTERSPSVEPIWVAVDACDLQHLPYKEESDEDSAAEKSSDDKSAAPVGSSSTAKATSGDLPAKSLTAESAAQLQNGKESAAASAAAESVLLTGSKGQPAKAYARATPSLRPPISTHVLDTARGLPVPGLHVSLYQLVQGRWTHISDTITNPDGRCSEDLITRESIRAGRFKLHFDTSKYFNLRNQDCLFPFIEVVFDVCQPSDHLHIPLLMTPFGYSVYKGS